MISAAQSRRSQELAAAREAFVTATVVRVERPASVEPGSVALVLANGTIEGFVGGSCTEHSVRAYSLVALENEEPVLLRIVPDPPEGEAVPDIAELEREGAPDAAEVKRDGNVVTVENPCLSGGVIEVFLEPAPPAPRVLVVGETPITAALLRIGVEAGLEMVPVEGGGSGGGESTGPGRDDLALVVASHGHSELGTLRHGLEAEVPYVGLVASEKRGAGVLAELRADGVAEELLGRIDIPAGVPISSRTPGEIAVSILAKLIAVRREELAADDVRQRASAPGTPPAPRASGSRSPTAVDPICGMTVAAVSGTLSLERDGETVYFCCQGCKETFEAQGEHASLSG